MYLHTYIDHNTEFGHSASNLLLKSIRGCICLTEYCFSLLLEFAFNDLLCSAAAGLSREVYDDRHQISLFLQAVQEPLCYHRLLCSSV